MFSTTELTKLPVAERLALIEVLWTSIPEGEMVAEAAQIELARTRLQELKANPSIGLSYEEFKARIG